MNLTIIAITGLISLLVMMILGMNIGVCMLVVGAVGYAVIAGIPAAVGLL